MKKEEKHQYVDQKRGKGLKGKRNNKERRKKKDSEGPAWKNRY